MCFIMLSDVRIVYALRACLFLMNGEKVLGVYIESAANRHRLHDPIILLPMLADMTWAPDFASDLCPVPGHCYYC